MPSTYTTNGGIELPANGEQSGTWGETVNDNMAIIDRLTNGVGAISLSGTTHTLTTADGTLSDGQYNVLVLGGSPSGTNTITISPNDGEHVYVVKNASGQTATFTQGSGANVSVLNNTTKIIYADGAGAGAAVVDITGALDLGSLIIAGTSVTATAAELNFVDGVTSNVQTQLNTKAPLASPTFTGTATVSGNLSVDGGTIKLDGNYPVGTGNVALGDAALDDGSLSGGYNTAIGRSSLTANTTGAENTGIGNQTLQANTSGSNNNALGTTSLYSNTTGSNNTAAGYQSLFSNTTASENTAVGYQAAYSNTTGVRLVAVGYQALLTNTTGTNNVAVGKGALQLNTTGSSNIGIGYGAGVNVTTGLANTLVGNDWTGVWGACGEAITTGSGNSFYGTGSGRVVTTGSKNTIIGAYSGNQGSLDIRTSDNNIVLSDGDGNPRVIVDSSGNVLVGKTASNSTVAGSQLNANGLIIGTTSETNPILLNRLSTDGDIILMQKDGTTVGSIGAAAGGININSQGGDFAIRRSGGDVLYVGTTATYPATDNGKDLGVSSYRWKDLYLSGGVVFNVAGGTGTSTSGTLDDYEEGTWTAAVSGGTTVLTNVTGYYTKIGNVVTFSYYTGTSDLSSASGGMTITGLPFAASNGTSFNTAVNIAHNTFFGGSATEGQDAYVGTNGTTIYMVTTGTTTTSTFTDGTGKFLMISGTYYTSS
jgi:hypothetical protein